jgi:paraquat-inducible protein A
MSRPREAVHSDGHLSAAWAFIAAGVIFYFPANLIPVMTITITGQVSNLTVWGGVEELYESGLGPVAVIVFFASLCVPFLKLIGLAWLLWSCRQIRHEGGQSDAWRLRRLRVLRLIRIFGKWSMIDIFLLSVLVAVGQLGILASVLAKPGAFFFSSTLVFTLIATELFDPRWLWQGALPPPEEKAS